MTFYALFSLKWFIKETDMGHHTDYVANPMKHFEGIFESYELACETSFTLPDIESWVPHIWIYEVSLNTMNNIDPEVDLYSYDYMIVNKVHRVLFSHNGVKYGEMDPTDINLYKRIKDSHKGSERYADYKLLYKLNISRNYHPGFDEFSYNKLSNPSFVYGLSLHTIKELIKELNL
jgi:hypothetical protein